MHKKEIGLILGAALGVFVGNLAAMLFGVNYSDAASFGGMSIVPAVIGAFIGCTLYRLLSKHKYLAHSLAFGVAFGVFAAIGALTIPQLNGESAVFIINGKPIGSFVSGFAGGAVAGLLLAGPLRRQPIKT